MSKEQIYEKLNEIFRMVFDDADLSINAATCSADIDGWDSLMHITLINAIEGEFNIVFAMKDIVDMKNVGDMADCVFAMLN